MDGLTPRQDFWSKEASKTPRIYDIQLSDRERVSAKMRHLRSKKVIPKEKIQFG